MAAGLRGSQLLCHDCSSLEEALQDPQFRERGLFARTVRTEAGDKPALPIPVAPQFRSRT